MILNNETLKTLFVSFKTLFQRGLSYRTQWQDVATEMKSSSKANIYGWLGKFPKMREWISKRTLSDMKATGYTVVNKKYEATVTVDKDDIDDDQLGIYEPIMEQAGQSANEHVDEIVFGAYANGFVEKCYDEQPYFSDKLVIYEKEDGTGEQKTVSNIINPAVIDNPAWFLIDASRPIKPVIYQNRKEATLTTVSNVANEHVFMEDKLLFGVDARRAVGYSFWQLAVGSRDVLNQKNFQAAYAALLGKKTDGGRPLGTKATTLLVPLELLSVAEGIIKKQNLAGGESNIDYNRVKIVCSPYLVATAALATASEEHTEQTE